MGMEILDTDCKVLVEIKGKEMWKTFFTINQLADKTGRSVAQIRNYLVTVDSTNGGTKLTAVYPFPNSKSEEDLETGIKCVLLDAKCERFIERCKRNPLKKY